MDYFNSLLDSINTSYHKTMTYLYFEENDNEIIRKMRVCQSDRDWLGVSQSLVIDKRWLNSLRDLFSTLVVYRYGHGHSLCDQYTLSRFKSRQELSDGNISLSPTTGTPNSESSTYETLYITSELSDEYLVKMTELVVLLNNIHLISTDVKYIKLIRYFFSDDLYTTKSHEKGTIAEAGFLANFSKCLLEPKATKLKKILGEIYTIETLDRMVQLFIMFGCLPPLLKSHIPNYHTIQSFLV